MKFTNDWLLSALYTLNNLCGLFRTSLYTSFIRGGLNFKQLLHKILFITDICLNVYMKIRLEMKLQNHKCQILIFFWKFVCETIFADNINFAKYCDLLYIYQMKKPVISLKAKVIATLQNLL